MINKRDNSLRIVYGIALENAGIKLALNDIDDLLKRDNKFGEFFKSETEFMSFQTLFLVSRKNR